MPTARGRVSECDMISSPHDQRTHTVITRQATPHASCARVSIQQVVWDGASSPGGRMAPVIIGSVDALGNSSFRNACL